MGAPTPEESRLHQCFQNNNPKSVVTASHVLRQLAQGDPGFIPPRGGEKMKTATILLRGCGVTANDLDDGVNMILRA